jgi:hypothetical protein
MPADPDHLRELLLVAALAVAASRADDLMDVFREDEDEEDLR